LTVEFSKKALTVSGLSAASKEYDGTTLATVTGTPVLVGVVGTDVVGLSGVGVGSFSSKGVGSGKTVSISGYSLSGDQADRYQSVRSECDGGDHGQDGDGERV
jgi:hypothetical protein